MKTYSELTQRFAEAIAVFLFCAVLGLQSINIFFRYTKVSAPLMWVEEFSTFSFIWIFFLLWHLGDRNQTHFHVDVLLDRLSGKPRQFLELFGHAVAIFFAGVTVSSSVAFIPTTMMYSTNSFSWLPMGVIYLVIPFGLALVLIERLRLFAATWKRENP